MTGSCGHEQDGQMVTGSGESGRNGRQDRQTAGGSAADRSYMARALELARRGLGRTSPNPVVGAVIVKNGEIIGEGYHRRAGTPHAEIHALNEAGDCARGATLYVTLEPCTHFGRTPPCTEAIINAGVKRVVAAVVDPNPLMAGKGLARLQSAGIEVATGLLADEARQLNEVFFKWVTTGRPFVLVKTAMTLDGKIATSSGDSHWVTGPEARQYVHRLRDQYDAVLVGIGTALADDPRLTTRLPGGNGRDPVRVIVDSRLRLPVTARVLRLESQAPTLIACTQRADPEKRAALEETGAQVLVGPEQEDGRVDLEWLLGELAGRGITSIMSEGGAQINGALFARGLVDKVMFFLAPKVIGGTAAPGPIGGRGCDRMAEAVTLERVTVMAVGGDFLVTGYPVWNRREQGGA